MSKSYDDFFEALGQHESGGDYRKINTINFMGKYQMGEASLIDLGYYKPDGKDPDNLYQNKFWTGKDGINSKEDFLNRPDVQEKAVRKFAEINWRTIQINDLDLFVDRTVYGVKITISGLLAGAHLKGVGKKGLRSFLRSGYNGKDQYGTTVKSYIVEFAGYDTPFKARKKLTGIKKDKKGKTVMYQIDAKEWVSVEKAIQMVKDKLLDGVIVTNSKGTMFLKTRPDQTLANNLV